MSFANILIIFMEYAGVGACHKDDYNFKLFLNGILHLNHCMQRVRYFVSAQSGA
jgi:hypothetical protein